MAKKKSKEALAPEVREIAKQARWMRDRRRGVCQRCEHAYRDHRSCAPGCWVKGCQCQGWLP